ncbi:expressed unknown protein [Seminavis robusta]|uniref:Transmembrane protein n=1 Tax=Seminavis robusta TaxID=568900 RepID=A0A9N8EX23_9STRA|nr:expressed unknown protein [Seminavis robusta]|eukprot:Sro2293_g322280.1 n/a (864) ;mRNA; f:10594-13185
MADRSSSVSEATETMEETPSFCWSSVAEEPSSLDTTRHRPSIVGIGGRDLNVASDDNNTEQQPRASEPNVLLATARDSLSAIDSDSSRRLVGSGCSSHPISTGSGSFRGSTGVDTPEAVRVLVKELMETDRQAKRATRQSLRQTVAMPARTPVPDIVVQHEATMGLSKGLPADKFKNSSRSFEDDLTARTSVSTVGTSASNRSFEHDLTARTSVSTVGTSATNPRRIREADALLPGAYALQGGREPRHSSRRRRVQEEGKQEDDIEIPPPPLLIEATLVPQVSERVIVTTNADTIDYNDIEQHTALPTLRAVEVEEVELRDLLKNRRLQRFICCLVCVAMLFAAGIAAVLVSEADSQDDPMWIGDTEASVAQDDHASLGTTSQTNMPDPRETKPNEAGELADDGVIQNEGGFGSDDDDDVVAKFFEGLFGAIAANVDEEFSTDDDLSPQDTAEFVSFFIGKTNGGNDSADLEGGEDSIDHHREYFRQVLIFIDQPVWNDTTMPAFEALQVEYAKQFIIATVSESQNDHLSIGPEVLRSIIDEMNVECHVTSQSAETISLLDTFGRRGLLEEQHHRHLPLFAEDVWVSEVLYEMIWDTPGIRTTHDSPGVLMQEGALENLEGCIEDLQGVFGPTLVSTTPPLLLLDGGMGGAGSVTTAFRQWLFPQEGRDPNVATFESVLKDHSNRFLQERVAVMAESAGIEFIPEEIKTNCSVLLKYQHGKPRRRGYRALRAPSPSTHLKGDRGLSSPGSFKMMFVQYAIVWYNSDPPSGTSVDDSLARLPALFEEYLNDHMESLTEDLIPVGEIRSFPVRIVGPPPPPPPSTNSLPDQDATWKELPQTLVPSLQDTFLASQTLVPSFQGTFI